MSDESELPENFGVLNRLSTSALAKKQQNQGATNNCVFHTIATVVNIHCKQKICGKDWASDYDASWKQTPFKYRVKPNWATTPYQARRVLYDQSLKSQANPDPADRFTVVCKIRLLSDEILKATLKNHPETYLVMSFLWFTGKITLLSHKGKLDFQKSTNPGLGAHTMLLAAYNPENRSDKGVLHPWGFVNSWMESGVTDIFWMDEVAWKRLIKLPTLMVNFTHPLHMVV